MSKRVTITEKIQARIRAAVGDPDLNTNDLAVYEARFLTTEPLTKGGFFNKARVSPPTLFQMAAYLTEEGKARPLHIMHEDDILPIGKVFSAEARTMANGETELRGQFYIPLSETASLTKLDNAVVDEVSVGMLNTHAFCSECEFDYFGAEAGWTNFMDLSCSEGHKIGVDGVHVRLAGLESWSELSLVGAGAAKNAKIMPRIKQVMAKADYERLAASGAPADARLVTTSYKIEDATPPTQEEPKMDLKEILAQLSASTTDAATVKVELATAKATVDTQAARITELETQLAASAATVDADKATLQTELDAAKADLKTADEKLVPHFEAAFTASGDAKIEAPVGLVAKLAMIEEKALKLHQVVGAKSDATDKQATLQSNEDARKSAFKLSK